MERRQALSETMTSPLIQGVIVAAVTPRRETGEVDLGSSLELVDRLVDAGVHGIAALGSTGEFLHLDHEERNKLLRFMIKRSKVPVVAGVSHSTLDVTAALAHEAADAGAAAVLVMPPYFFRYSQPDIREFFLRLSDRVSGRVPILLYNIPFFTNELASSTAVELLRTGRFAGIKDSSGDPAYFAALKALHAEMPFTMLIGNDTMFIRGRSDGAHGVVSGTACGAPELMTALDAAVAANDASRIAKLEPLLNDFLAWIEFFPATMVVRAAVECRGVRLGPPATPLAPESARKLNEFNAWFPGWLRAVESAARG
jgi:4-hydroxy-tetrahydrodipicolinate synthase